MSTSLLKVAFLYQVCRWDTVVIFLIVCLQLRTTISFASELRFGCSWTLWKAHKVKILSMYLWKAVGDHNYAENLCFAPSMQVT